MSDSFYIFVEALRSTYLAGGVVMLPILLVGVVGFYFLFSAWVRIGKEYFSSDIHRVVKNVRRDLNGGQRDDQLNPPGDAKAERRLRKRGGLISRELLVAMERARVNPDACESYMQVRILEQTREMERGARIISVMAAAAPLLGLLGTVTGMVSTFDVITLYGNQNPVLMADGISEALISTQSGLLVAFPLTLLKQRLNERTEAIRQKMELGTAVIVNYFKAKNRISAGE